MLDRGRLRSHNRPMGTFFDQASSLPEVFFSCAQQNPEKVLFSQSFIIKGEGEGRRPRNTWTFSEVADQVRSLTDFLRELGFASGQRAAIISNSRPEWMIADLAVLAAGGVVTSVYQSLTAPEVGYLLYDSGADVVFVENQEQLGKLKSLMSNEFEVAGTEERAAFRTTLKVRQIICFETCEEHPLVVPLRRATSRHSVPEKFELAPVKRTDLATLVYTSGTSGPPKGVMQTHGNHLSNLRQATQAGMYSPDSAIVLFLPLAHSFARLMAYIGCLAGPTISFPATTDRKSSKLDQLSVTRDIAEAEATIVPLVPRLLEKMKAGIEYHAHEPGPGSFLIRKMLESSALVYAARSEGRKPDRQAFFWYLATTPVRRVVRKRLFGPRFINAVSGGARLSEEVNIFFQALGITILQGYGLTETCVATNVNRLDNNRIGTVGPVLTPDIEMKIGADGEIMFRGPNVALGYLNREQATKAAWTEDGWFLTGDVGSVDAAGRLTITGRKKELIVTAGGKKIAPERIEGIVKTSPLFSQVVLVGEGKPYCCAVVTLNGAMLQEFAGQMSLTVGTPWSKDPAVARIVASEIARVNQQLASFETIKRCLILDEDFSVENGFMTPTFKVKRTLVIRTYAETIERLYRESDAG